MSTWSEYTNKVLSDSEIVAKVHAKEGAAVSGWTKDRTPTMSKKDAYERSKSLRLKRNE
jgi:hypothetical protein